MSEMREERWHWYQGARVPELVFGTSKHDRQQVLTQDEVADYLNALEQERDELRAKAALADKVFASGYMDWYEYTDQNEAGCYRCLFCGGIAWAEDMVDHPDHCPKRAYDSLIQEGK